MLTGWFCRHNFSGLEGILTDAFHKYWPNLAGLDLSWECVIGGFI